MARIRTVKPELWTDSDFVELSVTARLLFVALLNFASDYGVLPDKPKQLKMQCLPGDAVEIVPLLDELIARRFLVRTSAPDGGPVLVIRTFQQHQKVDKRSPGRWGDPATWTNPSLDFGEPSPKPPDSPRRTGQDGTGLDGGGRDNDNGPDATIHPLHPTDVESSLIDQIIETAAEAITDARSDVEDHDKYVRGTKKELRQHKTPLIRELIRTGDDPVAIAAVLAGSHVYASAAFRRLGYDKAMEA